jgi:DNA-binding transcriptional MerR regulator
MIPHSATQHNECRYYTTEHYRISLCIRYKQRALETHPDKFADQGEEVMKEATERFKELQDALEILTGEGMMRKLYVPCFFFCVILCNRHHTAHIPQVR